MTEREKRMTETKGKDGSEEGKSQQRGWKRTKERNNNNNREDEKGQWMMVQLYRRY